VIVYLTGGIGTGKSTVLRRLAELGATTIAADDIVRTLYADPLIQVQVSNALGLPLPFDRSAIADLVFSDADARERLESIVHPLVSDALERLRLQHFPSPLVYEIPLPPRPHPGDVVIVVTSPLELRIQRLLSRGLTAADARRRIAAQPADSVYGKQASIEIVNDGDVEALQRRVDEVWEELQRDSSQI